MPNIQVKICAAIVLSGQLLIASAGKGQDIASAFERSASYASAFEELDNLYDHYQAGREKLLAERGDALKRLAETNAAVGQLISLQGMQGLAALEGELLSYGQQTALDNRPSSDGITAVPNGTITPNNFTGSLDRRVVAQDTAAARQIAQTRVQIEMLKHQMKTANEAGRLALERRKSLLEDIQSITSELVSLESKSLELFNRYWELADVAAVKSEVELRAGRRMLERADTGNAGAQFAQAITLMRLGHFDEALTLLDRLAGVPALRGLALAARAELHARRNNPDAAAQDARQALSLAKADPRVRVHRAMALAAQGDLKAAESEWEAVLKFGAHEIAARRAIALINASAINLTDRNKARATESAQLASKLAGDEDWASTIALALAAAANGETDAAIDAAQRAARSAIGEKRRYCVALEEQIRSGARVVWKY